MNWKILVFSAVMSAPIRGNCQGGPPSAVINNPFTAQQWTIYSSTLPDGTVTQRAQRVDLSRASDGSTRFDMRILSGAAPQWQATGSAFVDIRNLPNHLIAHLDTASSTARIALIKKTATAAKPQLAPQGAVASGTPQSLGSKQLAGYTVAGIRHAYLLPKGTADPNQDVTLTIDTWYSPDLQINLATQTTDSLGNVISMTVSQLQTAEPDPSLFAIPPNYTTTSNAARASK